MTFGQLGMKHPSLAAMVDAVHARISREGLHQRFTAEAVEYMAACAQDILKQKIRSCTPLKSAWLRPFNRVMIVDSSGWQVDPGLCEFLPGYGGSASAAHCKIQVIYEYKQGELSFFDLTEGTYPDTRYTANLPNHAEEGDLWMSDLGYFCLKTFRQICKRGAYFLSRFRVGTTLLDPDSGNPIHIEEILESLTGNAYELKVLMGAQQKTRIACRLIALRVPEEVANQRRHKLRKEARKKGRSPSQLHLTMCDWTLMVTNAPETILPAERVRPFYSLRWQIELLFKQMKSVLGINCSNTGKEYRLRCEIYGKLIVAIFIQRIYAFYNPRLWNRTRRELSLEKLYKRIQERAGVLLLFILHSVSKAISYLKKEIPRLIKNCTKSRQLSRKTTLESLELGVFQPVQVLNIEMAA